MLAILFAVIVSSVIASPIPEDVDPRVVGGSNAAAGQFPYQVSLRTPSNSHFCGGSIISNVWVLTAAHCTYGSSASSVIVVVNTITINSGTAYAVAQIINHPSYSPNDNYYDIAVLRTSSPISFVTNVSPVSLASSAVAPGTYLTLSGWGLTSYPSSQLPYNLQYIRLQAISVAQCQSRLPGYPVYNGNQCTWNVAGQGACKGDSGGPLVLGTVQHGVVSWGLPCALGEPDVFTSVPAFRSWIQSITGV